MRWTEAGEAETWGEHGPLGVTYTCFMELQKSKNSDSKPLRQFELTCASHDGKLGCLGQVWGDGYPMLAVFG